LPGIDILFVHDGIQDSRGYHMIQQLRSEGHRVEVYMAVDSDMDVKVYAKQKGIKRVIIVSNESIEDIRV
ncbi:MAG: hypothetical protein IMZ47_00750, partial [Firmicutes bacterium]|nr:hypothetical protein [Bacillota bacterium]